MKDADRLGTPAGMAKVVHEEPGHLVIPPQTDAELSDSELESVSGGVSPHGAAGIVVTPAPPGPVPIPYPNISKV